MACNLDSRRPSRGDSRTVPHHGGPYLSAVAGQHHASRAYRHGVGRFSGPAHLGRQPELLEMGRSLGYLSALPKCRVGLGEELDEEELERDLAGESPNDEDEAVMDLS
jgi:hypothetical protein